MAGYHAAVGEFKSALELLRKQIALANPEALGEALVEVHTLASVHESSHSQEFLDLGKPDFDLPMVAYTTESLH